MLAAGCGSDSTGGVSKGRALNGGMQSTGRVGTEHAQIGEVFWAALPLPHNTSKDPVAIDKARFTQIPKGLKVGEYRVFNTKQVGGIYLLAYTGGKYGTKDPDTFTNYAGKPVRLNSKQESDYYYAVGVRPLDTEGARCCWWTRAAGGGGRC